MIEAAFPVQILVRGNEITVTGEAADAEQVGRLFEELVVLLEQGHELDPDNLGRSIEMLKADQRPTEVLDDRSRARPQEHPPEDVGPEALRRRGARQHRDVRDRARGNGQELPRGRARRAGVAGQGGEPHHPHPARGRGGGAARFPARRHAREGRPVPAPAVRRALRHARTGSRRPLDGAGHDRGCAARVHARPHAQRLVHHSRRGAEHHARADEDVPHPARLRFEVRGHRRRHPDRPSRRSASFRTARRCATCSHDIDGLEFVELGSSDVVRHRIVQDIVDAYGRHELPRA